MLRKLLDSESALYAVTGDAVWDARASSALGLPMIGVLSGGISRGELEAEGAAFVCDDVAQLLREEAESPLAQLY